MKEKIKSIQKECLRGKIEPHEAVSSIDGLIGGITRAELKEGKKYNLTNHNEVYSLNVKGFSKRELDRLHGMAVLSYFKAKENGSMFPGEIHISKKASTKDHTDGIYRILERYQS
jgi:hypothetical protein